jgi:hypothetical protein
MHPYTHTHTNTHKHTHTHTHKHTQLRLILHKAQNRITEAIQSCIKVLVQNAALEQLHMHPRTHADMHTQVHTSTCPSTYRHITHMNMQHMPLEYSFSYSFSTNC